MSWTVVLIKMEGGVRPIEQFDTQDMRPLGTPAEVRGLLSGVLPAIQWNSDVFALFDGDGFGMEVDIQKGDPTTAVGLRFVGGGDALGTIVQIVNALGWVAYDASSGDFIDPLNPSRLGWAASQAYRNRVVSQMANEP